MKYLLAAGGVVETDFGYITTPGHRGIPAGIIAGLPWAADNEAFTKAFDPDKYFSWLETMQPYKSTCLFVSVPDEFGNSSKTVMLFYQWRKKFDGWPVAFVAQDGQECWEFPDPALWQALFIGGTTEWKDGPEAVKVIKRAIQLGKQVHIGRVNEWKRYDKFSQLEKNLRCEFTCDGTKHRFIGVEKAIKRYRIFRERCLRQMGLPYNEARPQD